MRCLSYPRASVSTANILQLTMTFNGLIHTNVETKSSLSPTHMDNLNILKILYTEPLVLDLLKGRNHEKKKKILWILLMRMTVLDLIEYDKPLDADGVKGISEAVQEMKELFKALNARKLSLRAIMSIWSFLFQASYIVERANG